MHSKFCPICHARTPHKRQFGIGTLILFIITCGFWLLAMPFYPVRCSRCGGGQIRQALTKNGSSQRREYDFGHPQMASADELELADSLPPPEELTLCPLCREEIKVGALKCRHCGERFERPVTA